MNRLEQAKRVASAAVERVPDSTKQSLALCCTLLSAVAVPVLTYIALLCTVESRLIEIPKADKPRAAFGSWIAAGMYAVTFWYCYNWKPRRAFSTISEERIPLTASRQ